MLGKDKKSEKLDIRVTPQEKERIRKAASDEGMEISAWVMQRLLAKSSVRFLELVRDAAKKADSFSLAALADFLVSLKGKDLQVAVETFPVDVHGAFIRAYVAAMVERACEQKNVPMPPWTSEVPPVDEPYFASDLFALRGYLLVNAPLPFRKRNLFVDASVGDRV